MLLRKWVFLLRSRQPVGPAPFCILNAGGLRISKTSSFARSRKKLPQNAASAAMVPACGWQKVLRKSIKHKVQRWGRNSYSKNTFGASSTQNKNWTPWISYSGPFDQIAQERNERIEPTSGCFRYSILTCILLYYDNDFAHMRIEGVLLKPSSVLGCFILEMKFFNIQCHFSLRHSSF